MTEQPAFQQIRLEYILNISKDKPQVVVPLLRSYSLKLPRAREAMRGYLDSRTHHMLGLVSFQIKEILPVLGLRELTGELADLAQWCLQEPDWPACEAVVHKFEQNLPAILEDIQAAIAWMEAAQTP